jgi:DNA-binding FadR family transcriptional regulator
LFENLSAPKKSSLVYNQIVERIESEEFPAGTKLPNELELSHLLGVSRPVVREALSALEIVERIERRAGDGTYVKGIPAKFDNFLFSKESVMIRLLEKIDKSGGSFAAFEARSLMEPVLAGIAAIRADELDIEEMLSIKSCFERALGEFDRELFRRTDVEFHRFVARTCKNELLEKFMLGVIDTEKFPLWRREINWPTHERMKISVEEHLDVIRAILDRDRRASCEAMERHFVFHWREVARALESVEAAQLDF